MMGNSKPNKTSAAIFIGLRRLARWIQRGCLSLFCRSCCCCLIGNGAAGDSLWRAGTLSSHGICPGTGGRTGPLGCRARRRGEIQRGCSTASTGHARSWSFAPRVAAWLLARAPPVALRLRRAMAERLPFRLTVPGKIHRVYRGRLTIDSAARNGELLAVVSMDRETAVASIVAAEMAESSPMEALKAQAVATRSFLAAGARHQDFDFCDTTHCQFLKSPPPLDEPGLSAVAGHAGPGHCLSRQTAGGHVLQPLRRPDAQPARCRHGAGSGISLLCCAVPVVPAAPIHMAKQSRRQRASASTRQ